MKKLPPLLSLRQFAAYTGRTPATIRTARKAGRFRPAPALVDGRWIFWKYTKFTRKHLGDDILLRGLPDELIANDDGIRHEDAIPERDIDPPETLGRTKKVVAWGFNRIVGDMPRDDVVALCGVGTPTVKKLRDQKPVRPDVIVRLARGLEVEVSDLLRKDV